MTGFVLSIDDAEEEVAPLVSGEHTLEVVDPGDEDLAQKLAEKLPLASVILLDQKFFADMDPLSLKAADGASFVAHLRSWSRKGAIALAPLILLTNEEQAFANEVPAVGAALPLGGTFVGREFRIAPALDVEWVQLKSADGTKSRIDQLVRASDNAASLVGDDGVSLAELEDLLCLPSDRIWTEKARLELRAARPPVSQTSDEASDPFGASQIIRWLCHRALPFPGMLFSDIHAAWALGVSVEDFRSIRSSSAETPWMDDLIEAEYCGPLDEFMGRRWWKSGIDYLVWKLDQEAVRQGDRASAIKVLAPGAQVKEFFSVSAHVVTWTPDLQEETISSIDDSAQLRPPGWPVEALEPWIQKCDLDNDAILTSMVAEDD
ncbi:hypothetical protein PMI42_05926 [Bradyrhizobium sp. YR681]|uniref:hypothetical protein n=1 Tax=Bradyrhizobium sp. YR681 TaxID=1144344 RepID=UPI00026F7450|nr:hypothetical protein [Bradyrhizobium sp. YR681]EJN10758.1 hypothetical protein PMI42_05926 [Bradyrhizobium sp. YR681]